MTVPQSPMTIPHSPRTGGEAHAEAVQRLDAARDAQHRRRQDDDEAQGSQRELGTGVELSAANERVAASEAWLHYIERGY
jgi:hypothetical protein